MSLDSTSRVMVLPVRVLTKLDWPGELDGVGVGRGAYICTVERKEWMLVIAEQKREGGWGLTGCGV